ncbi:NAD(P)H-dependent oxidoreductase [Pseudomonas sp. SZMC_28357]|uniref:FMN-dependent NADH-azoreductase n=1 Tax=Pseudomonas sp. SZMC_28357 TaxID=3074380 RepID=UPI0028722A1F|nr:NAD(P)H-dependent oxidoreductase [Pseudomonas sp. SZMC_28357]MDR9749898.1 NAD(P)H-dependent oxidoreductase [Pseudomonas sp. SZMC_28357]
MKLLHVDASPKGGRSNSRALARYFIASLQEQGVNLEIDYLDLRQQPPAHIDRSFTIAAYTPAAERTAAMKQALEPSDALCRRVLEADAFVFAMPMHNFSYPSVFKAFIDNIVRAELTYLVDDSGHYIGQLSRQKALFITTRGTDMRAGQPLSHMDALTHSLQSAFGFVGVQAPTFVDAQPTQFAATIEREQALARARIELLAVARDWVKQLP